MYYQQTEEIEGLIDNINTLSESKLIEVFDIYFQVIYKEKYQQNQRKYQEFQEQCQNYNKVKKFIEKKQISEDFYKFKPIKDFIQEDEVKKKIKIEI